MSSLTEVILYSLAGGVLSLIGGLLLLSNKKITDRAVAYATPFAAGALLAAAFLDLLPEAAEQGSVDTALKAVLAGVLVFFVLERFLRWFHHHHEHDDQESDPTIPLIIVGDTLHNFIDGIAIAAGFLIDPSTGALVTLAVAAHEIPQEIGDFGLLLQKGMARRKVIMVNVASALATTIAAVIFFSLGQSVDLPLDIITGLVSGFFIYIALSDIIPSIHESEGRALAGLQSFVLMAGVLSVGLTNSYLHQYIDQGHDHDSESSHAQTDDDEGDHDEEHSAEEGDVHADEEMHEEDGDHSEEDVHDDQESQSETDEHGHSDE